MTAQQDFIFEEWAALAEYNPVEFERRRHELLSAKIAEMPTHLASTKDGLRKALLGHDRTDKPALDRAVDAFNLMQASVCELTDACGSLARCLPLDAAEPKVELSAADRYSRLTVE